MNNDWKKEFKKYWYGKERHHIQVENFIQSLLDKQIEQAKAEERGRIARLIDSKTNLLTLLKELLNDRNNTN